MSEWAAAKDKLLREGACRVCGNTDELDPAHVIPRSLGGQMNANSIVPLCRKCHTAYDNHKLSLLGHLTTAEECEAVRVIGLHSAYHRIGKTRWNGAESR